MISSSFGHDETVLTYHLCKFSFKKEIACRVNCLRRAKEGRQESTDVARRSLAVLQEELLDRCRPNCRGEVSWTGAYSNPTTKSWALAALLSGWDAKVRLSALLRFQKD